MGCRASLLAHYYEHVLVQTRKNKLKTNSKPKMEAERRSTMSSLKGQLSNVEGSVKSMKVAVVVGSVLTVACLAAVFGVTVLANEVSKEVKVSNGVLATKAGSSVLTASLLATEDLTPSGGDSSIVFNVEGKTVNAKVAAAIAGVEGGEILNAISDCAERVAASAFNMVSPGRNALPACGNAPASGYYTPIE